MNSFSGNIFHVTLVSQVSHVQYSSQQLRNLPVLLVSEHQHLSKQTQATIITFQCLSNIR